MFNDIFDDDATHECPIVNPASGLPMIDDDISGFDIADNIFGTDASDDEFENDYFSDNDYF